MRLLPFQVQLSFAHSIVLSRLLGSSQYLFHDVHSPERHVVRPRYALAFRGTTTWASENFAPHLTCCRDLMLPHFLVLSSFADDSNDCLLSTGARLSIAASTSYYICAALLCCFPRANPCFQRSQMTSNNDNSRVEKVSEGEERGRGGRDSDLYLPPWAPATH
jgi:hypothetical protein